MQTYSNISKQVSSYILLLFLVACGGGGNKDINEDANAIDEPGEEKGALMQKCRIGVYDKVSEDTALRPDSNVIKDAVNAVLEKETNYNLENNLNYCLENQESLVFEAVKLVNSVEYKPHFNSTEDMLADPRMNNIKTYLQSISCYNEADDFTIDGIYFVNAVQDLLLPDRENDFQAFLDKFNCTTAYITTSSYGAALSSIKVYMTRIASMMKTEITQLTPWTINSYTQLEIELLVRVNTFLEWNVPSEVWTATGLHSRFQIPGIELLPYDDESTLYERHRTDGKFYMYDLEFYKLAPISKQFVRWDIESTTNIALSWMMANFFHAHDYWGWDHYADGRESRSFYDPQNLERLLDERIVGCHLASMLFRNLLAVLNIPSVNIRVDGHAVTYLPLQGEFIHGDHLADIGLISPIKLVYLSNNDIEEIFLTDRDYVDFESDFTDESNAVVSLYREANSNRLYYSIFKPKASLDLFNTEMKALNLPEFTDTFDEPTKFISESVPIKTLSELQADVIE